MRKISLDKINSMFEEIAKDTALYLPVDENDGSAKYKKWEQGVVWSEKLNTVRSPKDFFFPQMEDLMEFKTSGKTIEVIDTRSETEEFVIPELEMDEPVLEPEPVVVLAPVMDDPNRAMTADEIAALFASVSGESSAAEEDLVIPEPEVEVPVPEPVVAPAPVMDDPNRAMTPDEIAALIASMK